MTSPLGRPGSMDGVRRGENGSALGLAHDLVQMAAGRDAEGLAAHADRRR